MNDEGNELTEQQLAELEDRIAEVFSEAKEDLDRQIDEYFAQFAARDAKQAALVAAGELEEAVYILWRLNQIGRGARFEALRDKVAERVTNANEYAADYINAATPGIYALNRNYTAYTVDKLTGGAFSLDHGAKLGIDFTLWDENTVKRLITKQPDLMPHYPEERAVKRGIDLAYGKKQITAQVTSSILSGDSIGRIADRLQQRIVGMSRASAIRAARTATTEAQNAGRQDGYAEAAKMGIEVRKRWIATKDGRTRNEHGKADGQTVPYDRPFSVGGEMLMYPGDPNGSPRNIYNCRCTTRTVEKEGIEAEPRMMRVRDANGRNVVVPEMTYSEWKEWVEKSQDNAAGSSTMYRRRISSYGHEIIDQPTYHKLTAEFVRGGGMIIRGEEAARMLDSCNASAAYIVGGNAAYIRDEATVSDVIEEMFHAKQDRRNAFGNVLEGNLEEILLLREIEAQKYLQSVAEKYKIPLEERIVTESNLAAYERKRDEKGAV